MDGSNKKRLETHSGGEPVTLWQPKRSLLRDEDWDFLALNSESRGESKVLRFRSERPALQALNTGKRVSGSTEGRADEHKSDGQGEGRRQAKNRKGVRFGLRSESGAANLSPKHYQLQVPTNGYQGPSADSEISLKWALAHIRFWFGKECL